MSNRNDYDRRFTSTGDVLKDGGSAKNIGSPKLVGPVAGVVNWKTMEFWMGNGQGSENYRNRVNWRQIDMGGIKFSSNPVNDSVVLIPEATEFKVVSEIIYGSENEEASGGPGGILDAFKAGVEIFTGAVAKPEWGAQTFSDLSQMSIATEYTFKFAYGKFGLYNAFEEVIKPILALTLFFGVEAGKADASWDGHMLNSAATSIANPTPTKAQFLAERVKGAIGTFKGISLDDLNGGPADTMAKANALIQSALAIGAGAQNVSMSSDYRNLYMGWGRFMFGPLQYKKIEYSLDQKNLDVNGWPTSGQFTLGGITSMRKSTTQALISPFVRGV